MLLEPSVSGSIQNVSGTWNHESRGGVVTEEPTDLRGRIWMQVHDLLKKQRPIGHILNTSCTSRNTTFSVGIGISYDLVDTAMSVSQQVHLVSKLFSQRGIFILCCFTV